MIGDFAVVTDALAGRDVIVLGNGPTVNLWNSEADDGAAIVTVNAGLAYVAGSGRRADLIWVQDERFLPRRADTLLPFVDRVRVLALNQRLIPQLPARISPAVVGLRVLGPDGFSRDPRLGVSHGYTAVYGLLQILAAAAVRRIDLYGVPLLYWSTATRFDQARRGADVDLHRASNQVVGLARGIATLRREGTAVIVHGDSALSRATLPPDAADLDSPGGFGGGGGPSVYTRGRKAPPRAARVGPEPGM
jgi:hypothetical protein